MKPVRVFLSYAGEDGAVAEEAASGLELHGYKTWYYERDSIPGPSYLQQVSREIVSSDAVLVLISATALKSQQVTNEIVLAHESGKPFIPVLIGLSHEEFQNSRLEWRAALGAYSSIRIPSSGIPAIIPRIVSGLSYVGLLPLEPNSDSACLPDRPHTLDIDKADADTPEVGRAVPPSSLWHRVGPCEVRLDVAFDRRQYPAAEDSEVRFLLEAAIRPLVRETPLKIPADIVLLLDVSGSMRKENHFELLKTAVGEFITRLDRDDSATIILFSDRAQLITKFQLGRSIKSDSATILQNIQQSSVLFGGKTNLVSALEIAAHEFHSLDARPGAVRRTYILTDGGFHDAEQCGAALDAMRQLKSELGIYAFGTAVPVRALRRLLAKQFGGWVKPIVNHSDVVDTFAHIANVNRNLVAQEARLVIDFDQQIRRGDAWSFRPYEIYFGQVAKKRSICGLGPVESGRTYSMLFEMRLPLESRSPATTKVADVTFVWKNAHGIHQRRGNIFAVRDDRAHDSSAANDRVRRAFAVLDALRHSGDEEVQLRAERAKLELAVDEGRDPALIEAIGKKIRLLELKLNPSEILIDSSLDELNLSEIMLTETTWDSAISFESGPEETESSPLALPLDGDEDPISLDLSDNADEI